MIIIYTCCGFDVTYIYSCGNVLCVGGVGGGRAYRMIWVGGPDKTFTVSQQVFDI